MPVAIVTGAAGGIGRATCLKLTELGHAIVLAGRTASKLEAVGEEIRRNGGEPLVVTADVSHHEDVQRLITRTLETFGRIDVLVNNAGSAPMIPTTDVTPEQWRDILDTNLSAAFYGTRAVWPVMQRQHLEYVSDHRDKGNAAEHDRKINTGGIIINISSAASRDPFPGLGAYAIAKAGVNMLTHVTAREGEPNGIRVFCIAPSGVETSMFRGLLTTEQVPASEVLKPEEVAEVVGACVGGALWNMNGETVYVHRRL